MAGLFDDSVEPSGGEFIDVLCREQLTQGGTGPQSRSQSKHAKRTEVTGLVINWLCSDKHSRLSPPSTSCFGRRSSQTTARLGNAIRSGSSANVTGMLRAMQVHYRCIS
jgi:hypothetical protein